MTLYKVLRMYKPVAYEVREEEAQERTTGRLVLDEQSGVGIVLSAHVAGLSRLAPRQPICPWMPAHQYRDEVAPSSDNAGTLIFKT